MEISNRFSQLKEIIISPFILFHYHEIQNVYNSQNYLIELETDEIMIN